MGVGVHPEASSECFIDFQAEFGKKVHLNSQFPGTERLPNTCNFSIRGPQLQGDDRLLVSPVLEAGGSGPGGRGEWGQQPSRAGPGPLALLHGPRATESPGGRPPGELRAGWLGRSCRQLSEGEE